MSKKEGHILNSNLPYKMGHYLLDRRYVVSFDLHIQNIRSISSGVIFLKPLVKRCDTLCGKSAPIAYRICWGHFLTLKRWQFFFYDKNLHLKEGGGGRRKLAKKCIKRIRCMLGALFLYEIGHM